MKSYTNITNIDRCSGLSEKELYKKYVKHSLPVAITDSAEWTSLEQFTPVYVKSHYNRLNRIIDGKTYQLSEIIDLCVASTPENKALYPNIYNVERDFPEYVVLYLKCIMVNLTDYIVVWYLILLLKAPIIRNCFLEEKGVPSQRSILII